MNFLRKSLLIKQAINKPNFTLASKTTFAAGFVGFGMYQMQRYRMLSYCQGGVSDFNDYGGRLTTLNHIPSVKHLMS